MKRETVKRKQGQRGHYIKNVENQDKVKLIKKMAIVYTTTRGCTYDTLAKQFQVHRCTVIRYFNRDLPQISDMLYAAVKRKANLNIEAALEQGHATMSVQRLMARLQRELYDESKDKS